MTTQKTLPREVVERHFDDAIECARLLGAAEARKEFGVFNATDGRFVQSMYQSIADHRRAALTEQESSLVATEGMPAGMGNEPEILAEYTGFNGHRQWVTVGAWLYPGDCVAVLSPQPAKREPLTPEQVRDGIADWIDTNIKHREFWTPEVVELIRSIEINGGPAGITKGQQ